MQPIATSATSRAKRPRPIVAAVTAVAAAMWTFPTIAYTPSVNVKIVALAVVVEYSFEPNEQTYPKGECHPALDD